MGFLLLFFCVFSSLLCFETKINIKKKEIKFIFYFFFFFFFFKGGLITGICLECLSQQVAHWLHYTDDVLRCTPKRRSSVNERLFVYLFEPW